MLFSPSQGNICRDFGGFQRSQNQSQTLASHLALLIAVIGRDQYFLRTYFERDALVTRLIIFYMRERLRVSSPLLYRMKMISTLWIPRHSLCFLNPAGARLEISIPILSDKSLSSKMISTLLDLSSVWRYSLRCRCCSFPAWPQE